MHFMKIIALVVLITYVPSFAFGVPVLLFPEEVTKNDSTCLRSQLQGKMDASDMHTSGNWFVAGFFSGVLLGLVGTGVTLAIAAGPSPTPKQMPDDPDIDLVCYVNGYESKAKGKNMLHAGLGGLLGTAVWVAAYFVFIHDDKK